MRSRNYRSLTQLAALTLPWLLVSSPAAAQQHVTDDWYGTLDVGPTELRIVLHVQPADGGYTATLDTPDQSASGIPLDEILYEGGRLVFRVRAAIGSIQYSDLSSMTLSMQ